MRRHEREKHQGRCIENTAELERRRLAETVVEAARHALQVAHAARARRLAALALLAPVVRAQLRRRVRALRTRLLLLVERAVAAAAAQRVCLCVALTKASRALRHRCVDGCRKKTTPAGVFTRPAAVSHCGRPIDQAITRVCIQK